MRLFMRGFVVVALALAIFNLSGISLVFAQSSASPIEIPITTNYNNAGTALTGGAYDGSGNAYVATSLPPTQFDVTINGSSVPFAFPSNLPTTAFDNVVTEDQTISVNAPTSYRTLFLLASATDVSYNYTSVLITLKYQNGTSQQTSMAVSDWVLPGSYYPPDEAVVYRNPEWVHDGQIVPAGQGEIGGNNTHFYLVSVPLSNASSLQQIQFGNNSEFHIWAMTVSNALPLVPPTLSIAAASYQLSVDQSDTLTIHVTNSSSESQTAAPVTLTTTAPASVTPTTVTTNSSGNATVVFRSPAAGIFKVTAHAGTLSSAVQITVGHPASTASLQSPRWWGYYSGAPYSAEPINVANGNFVAQVTDATYPSMGSPLTIMRTYNSLSHVRGPLGVGWSLTYFDHLTVTTNTVSLWRSDGRELIFHLGATGQWMPTTPTQTQLVSDPNGFTWVRQDGTRATFNEAGELVGLVRPDGHLTTFAYTQGRLTTVTDASGQSLQFSYNSNELITRITLPNGHDISFQYNSADDLIEVTDPGNQTYRYVYDSADQMLQAIDPNGLTVVTNTYNNAGQVTTQTGPLGGTWHFQYDPQAFTATVTDPLGHSTRYAFNTEGQLTTRTLPTGASWAYQYDGRGLVTHVTNPLGGTTAYSYDGSGNLVGITVGSSMWTLAYNGSHEITQLIEPTGATYAIHYNSAQNPSEITLPTGATELIKYNAQNEPMSIIDAVGGTYYLTYNRLGEVATMATPSGGTESFTYGSDGLPTRVVTPTGDVVQLTTNSAGQILDATDTQGRIESVTYDANGNPLSWTNALGDTTRATYNGLNQMTQLTMPGGQQWHYQYNTMGQLVQESLPDGSTVHVAYNGAGLPSSVITAHSTVSYGYNLLGQLTSVLNPTGLTTFGYSTQGQLTNITYPHQTSFALRYNQNGQLSNLQYPDGRSVAYSYTVLGQLARASTSWAGTTTYSYSPGGTLMLTALPSGITEHYQYANGLLESEVITNPHGHRQLSASYSYNSAAEKTCSTYTAQGHQVTRSYTYTVRGELSGELLSPSESVVYAYNPAGQRISQTIATRGGPKKTTSYQYNANGAVSKEATSFGKGKAQVTQLQYNNEGDLTKIIPLQGSPSQFTYSTMGNLTSATTDHHTMMFQYNGLGWLTGQSSGSDSSNSWQLLRVPMGTLAPTVSAQSSSGSIDYALGATRLTATQGSATTGWASLPDGSVVSTMNAGGELGALQTYGAFGMPQTPSGSQTPLTYGYGGYAQYNVGGANGLVLDHMGSRYYLPALGQYLTPDSQFATPSYSYAGNAPTVLTDPSGHEGLPGAIIGAGLGLASGLLTAFVVPNHMSMGQKVGTVVVDTFGGAASGVFGGEGGFLAETLGQVGSILASSGTSFATNLVARAVGGQRTSLNSVGTAFIFSFGFGGTSGIIAHGLTQFGAEENVASYASSLYIGHYSLATTPWTLPVSAWLHDITTAFPSIVGSKQGG